MNMNCKIKNLTILFWTITISRLIPMIYLPMTDTTEARYANTALLMSKLNDWITPYFDYNIPFWGKPPLSFWLQALSYDIFGIHDFTPRIPSLLVTLLTAWLIYKVLIILNDKYTALIAIIIYSSMLLVFSLSGAVLTDPYLTFSTTLSLVSFVMFINGYKKYWNYLFFAGIGLGILTKGPLSLVIVGGILVIWILLSFKQRFKIIKDLPVFSGTVLMLVISLPWYIMAELKTPGFLNYFIMGEHFGRFLDSGWQGDKYGTAHKNAHGTIWLMWFATSFPWGISAVYLFLKNIIDKEKRNKLFKILKDDTFSFYIVWMLFIMLFFTMAGNTLWTYILPSLPGFAILFAIYIGKSMINNNNFIIISSLIIPVISIVVLVYISLYPKSVSTEKFLIEEYQKISKANEDIYFIETKSFSSSYYMNKEVEIISLKKLNKMKIPSKYFIVIPNKYNKLINKEVFKKIYTSRKYTLLKAL